MNPVCWFTFAVLIESNKRSWCFLAKYSLLGINTSDCKIANGHDTLAFNHPISQLATCNASYQLTLPINFN